MKINKIDSLNTNTKRTRSNFPRTNQDLTSFGAAERGAASPIHSKKAAEAIKSKFLSGISFKGHTEFVKYEKIGTSGYYFLSEDPNNVYSGSKDSHSMRLLIGARPSSHADSSIEETRARNGYTTNRVYFAEPEEAVNEQTKKDHDFIVYDNRPHYPRPEQVRENYKMPGKNAVNYGQNFKTIAEYYVRREKADRKELEKLKGELKAFMPEYEQSVNYKKMLDEKEELFPWEVKDVTSDREKSDYYYDLNTKKYNDCLTQKSDGVEPKYDVFQKSYQQHMSLFFPCTPYFCRITNWKSHATLTLLAKQDLPTFGYNMIDPLKSWCWGSILFYPFKISRFS